jgi:hypothetical protein
VPFPPAGDIAIVVAGALVAGFVNGPDRHRLCPDGAGLLAAGHVAGDRGAAGAICSVAGHLQALRSIWSGVRWPRLWPFLAAGLLGVPLGTALLEHVQVQPLKLGVGILLIFYSAWMAFVRRPPVVTGGGRPADAAVGFVGGVMGGLASVSGPAPTIWVQLRGWNKNEQRGVNQPFNMAVLATALLAGRGRGPARPHVPRMGDHHRADQPGRGAARLMLYGRVNDAVFRQLVLVLLWPFGITLIVVVAEISCHPERSEGSHRRLQSARDPSLRSG